MKPPLHPHILSYRPTSEIFSEQQQLIFKQTDRLFAVLMAVQWVSNLPPGTRQDRDPRRHVQRVQQPEPALGRLHRAGREPEVRTAHGRIQRVPWPSVPVRGDVSFLKEQSAIAPKPESATSGWFICINDQPSLDFGGKRNPDGQGFAAFGRVVSGMDVVRKIQMAPSSENRTTNLEAQRLTPPIKILKASRVAP